MKTTVEIRYRIIRVRAHPERSGFVMSRPESVARLSNNFDLSRIVVGKRVSQVESGFVHRVPERVVVLICNDVYPRPAHAELIGLITQIHPAGWRSGVLRR